MTRSWEVTIIYNGQSILEPKVRLSNNSVQNLVISVVRNYESPNEPRKTKEVTVAKIWSQSHRANQEGKRNFDRLRHIDCDLHSTTGAMCASANPRSSPLTLPRIRDGSDHSAYSAQCQSRRRLSCTAYSMIRSL